MNTMMQFFNNIRRQNIHWTNCASQFFSRDTTNQNFNFFYFFIYQFIGLHFPHSSDISFYKYRARFIFNPWPHEAWKIPGNGDTYFFLGGKKKKKEERKRKKGRALKLRYRTRRKMEKNRSDESKLRRQLWELELRQWWRKNIVETMMNPRQNSDNSSMNTKVNRDDDDVLLWIQKRLRIRTSG